MTRRLQNKISESVLTLHVVAACTLVAWTLRGWTLSSGIALAVVVVVAYLLMEMDAIGGLLRIRSRMIPSVWLMLTIAFTAFHAYSPILLSVLGLALSFYFLFRTESEREPVGYTFRATFYLSLGSLAWPPLLLLLPLLLWSQIVFLRTMTLRSLCASLLGLVLPYIFWSAWVFSPLAEMIPTDWLPTTLGAAGDERFLAHLQAIIAPLAEPIRAASAGESPLADGWLNLYKEYGAAGYALRPLVAAHSDWLQARTLELASAAYLFLMAFPAFIHYLRNSYDDKISVRMQFYSLMLVQTVLALWLLLSPTSWHSLFPLLVLVSAPGIAHLFTFTRTWLTNAWFILCLIMWAILCVLPGPL